jgi:hypothetical protein
MKSLTTKHGLKLGELIEIDMTPKNLRSLGFQAKRGWSDIIEFKIIALYDDYCIGQTGSLHKLAIPYKLIFED